MSYAQVFVELTWTNEPTRCNSVSFNHGRGNGRGCSWGTVIDKVMSTNGFPKPNPGPDSPDPRRRPDRDPDPPPIKDKRPESPDPPVKTEAPPTPRQ
jgi:hypothetical protein